MLKNEIGKELEMIETYFLESLKAIFITILEYLENVPQEIAEFQQPDEAEEIEGENDQEQIFADAGLLQNNDTFTSPITSPDKPEMDITSNYNEEDGFGDIIIEQAGQKDLDKEKFTLLRLKRMFVAAMAEFKAREDAEYLYLNDDAFKEYLLMNHFKKDDI
jgi:hypothetical protein